MSAFSDRGIWRWLISVSFVVAAHGAVAAAIVHWHEAEDDAAPAAALVIDLAPVMSAPQMVQPDAPPGPEQVQADAAPSRPTEKVEETTEAKPEAKPEQEPQPQIPSAEKPEVALAEPAKPEPQPAPAESQTPAPATTAPQVVAPEKSAVAVAPAQGLPSVSDSNAVPNWQRQVVLLLERNKRYPAAARARGEKGIAQLAFSIDRHGKVVASHVVKSSGSQALDAEALELVQRAQPFPAPPPALPGAQIDLKVPVRFNVR